VVVYGRAGVSSDTQTPGDRFGSSRNPSRPWRGCPSLTAQLKQIRTQHQALESPRNQATVKWFDPVRGFGFLVLPDGVMHRQPLSGGMTVWCRVRQHPGGRLSAIRVSPS
jgi:cold shock CspA family protein